MDFNSPDAALPGGQQQNTALTDINGAGWGRPVATSFDIRTDAPTAHTELAGPGGFSALPDAQSILTDPNQAGRA